MGLLARLLYSAPQHLFNRKAENRPFGWKMQTGIRSRRRFFSTETPKTGLSDGKCRRAYVSRIRSGRNHYFGLPLDSNVHLNSHGFMIFARAERLPVIHPPPIEEGNFLPIMLKKQKALKRIFQNLLFYYILRKPAHIRSINFWIVPHIRFRYPKAPSFPHRNIRVPN